MKGFKKRLTPTNHRGASPSMSSTSSASSSYAQPFGQQLKQHAFRSSGKQDHPNSTAHVSKNTEIIIRALKPYNARRPAELSVNVGDFLQVIGEAWLPDGSGWFESINPCSGARGFVPIHFFQVFSSGGYQPTRPSNPAPSVSAISEIESSVPRNPKPIAIHHNSRPSLPSPHVTKKSPTSQSLITRQPLYGVVRYDFTPQRNDELRAEKGEAIVLIAHSHQDWFVAKPIGRLGGPGLIPVSYVEVKDLATGKGLRAEAVRKLMQDNILPGIDEWKQATAAYRGNSIPLGRFENPTATCTASQNISATLRRGMTKSHQQLRSKPSEVDIPVPRPSRSNIPPSLDQVTHLEEPRPVDIPLPSARSMEDIIISSDPMQSPQSVANWPQFSNHGHTIREQMKEPAEDTNAHSASGEDGYATVEDLRKRYGLLTHASVESFHKEQVQFWFHLRAHFSSSSSYNPTGEETTVLVLYRLYEDFFEFHAELLDLFPEEAGRQSYDKPNMFPKLPEPKEQVDEIVCAERVNTLSNYLEELSKLPSYIRDSEIFYEFLGPREGDIELLQESSPSVGSPESAEKSLTDEVEQLKHSEHDPATSCINNQIASDNGSQGPVQVTLSSLQRLSTPKSTESTNEHCMLSSEPHFQKIHENLSSQTPKPGHKAHTSNFSSSSTASLMDSVTAQVHTTQFPNGSHNSSPKSFYRIKIYQENNPDVIAIKATTSISRAELLQKVTERVYSFAPESPVDKGMGRLYIKDETKDYQRRKELESDEQLRQWLSEFQSRLVLLYTPAD